MGNKDSRECNRCDQSSSVRKEEHVKEYSGGPAYAGPGYVAPAYQNPSYGGSYKHEEKHKASNVQNDRIWSKEKPPTDQRVISRSLHPEWVHVWACITHRGKGPLVFIDPEVKINQWNYMEMLDEELIPWTKKTFWMGRRGRRVRRRVDFSTRFGHKAKETQAWLRKNVPDFINTKEWPPYSQDLNPLDLQGGYIE
uniref:Uncharacterized protein n=1 Tax=Acrobeloides nanus TaxID=290746 RepID=A0A914EG24_9BILA